MREVYREEGVSEVVGTILILAITVALFATVFMYTQHIPAAQKAAQVIIYPNIYIDNGTLFVNLSDKGGTILSGNSTYLIIDANGTIHSYLVYQLSKIMGNNILTRYGPGITLHFNSSNTFKVSENSTFSIILFSKQYNSILWKSQSYSSSNIFIVYAYSTPAQISPGEYFTIYAQVYTLQPSRTYASLNLSTLFGKGIDNNVTMQTLSVEGNIKLFYGTFVSPSFIPSKPTAEITSWISGTNMKSFESILLNGSYSMSPDVKIIPGGIVLQNPRPVHGTNDLVSILVQNSGPVGASFTLFVYDRFPNGTIPAMAPVQNDFGLKIVTSNEIAINSSFIVGAYSSTTINFLWENVGGNEPVAGQNFLIAGLSNITGLNGVNQINPPPNVTVPVPILPKILLVNDESNSYSGIENAQAYYSDLLTETGYAFKENWTWNSTISQNYLDSFDLVFWFTGNNSNGISSHYQDELNIFYQNGGKILVISGNNKSYQNSEKLDVNKPIKVFINPQAVNSMGIFETNTVSGNGLHYINATNYSFLYPYFATPPNLLDYPPVGQSGYYSQENNFMNISYNNENDIVGFYASNNHGGRAIIIGFEFARVILYQQDYVANKILMWLDNITVMPGIQLALTDIEFSTRTPLFNQPVTITFAISNLSNKTLGDITLEILIGSSLRVNETIQSINGNGSYYLYKYNWIASPPGPTKVIGIVDPFHNITQVNYALDYASSLVNTSIYVRYSTLVVFDHTNNMGFNTNSLNSTLENLNVSYFWMSFIPGSSQSLVSIQEKSVGLVSGFAPSSPSTTVEVGNLSNYFNEFNLVIIDFQSTDSQSSSLINASMQYAIEQYSLQKVRNEASPYTIMFMGNSTAGAIKGNSEIANLFGISLSSKSSTSSYTKNGNYYYLYGNNNSSNQALGFFGDNITNGYGLIIKESGNSGTSSLQFYNMSDTIEPNKKLFFSDPSNPTSASTGLIIDMNGFRIVVIPFGMSAVAGIIQPHTSTFAPSSPALDARAMLMLNILGYADLTINDAVPYVNPSSITFSSPVLMINRYYIISANISNLGSVPTNAVVQAFDGSGLFSSQTVYLSALSSTPVQFIWDPQYAALPSNPRDIRIVVSYSTAKIPSILNFAREGIRDTPVYVFYDNLSTGNNWHSYATVWAWAGVNEYANEGSNANTFYSVQPYSSEGSVAYVEKYLSNGDIEPYNTVSGAIKQIDNSYWGLMPGSISGGYSLGTSSAYVDLINGENSWNQSYTYQVVTTRQLYIHGSKFAYLEFYALYKLALGGEGVAVFISPNGVGSGVWQWISPIQGYPGNVNYGPISGTGWNYPTNGADLLPAFTTVSGGENYGWQHYVFNISQYTSDSSIWVRFVLIIDSYGYYTGIYGNDLFYADDIKVIENQTTTGVGSSQGDLWNRENSNGLWFYNSSNFYNNEVDNVVSVPISFVNLQNATLSFITQYNIMVRFANAGDPTDVPNGFRLYVGYLASGGNIIWEQMDTRWAGEAGKIIPWQNASTIMSAYYSNVPAFHQTGSIISLTGYIGLTVYLKFEVNGDNSNYFKPATTSNWADFTDVVITGTSYADLVSVSSVWI